jgi:hypothetical protein
MLESRDVTGDPKRLTASLEWDLLADRRTLRELTLIDGLPAGTSTIEIFRDESYALHAEFTGEESGDREDYFGNMPRAGTFVQGLELEGLDTEDNQCRLIHAVRQGLKRMHHVQSRVRKFSGTMSLGGVHVSSAMPEEKAVAHSDWYLNGPREDVTFRRVTERTTRSTSTRKRLADKDAVEPTAQAVRAKSIAVDHCFVDAVNFKFIVAKVPQGFGPPWSRSLSVEYHADWGGIPEPEIREGVGEIMGFLLGRQLLHVGSTEYGSNGEWLRADARSPWGTAVVELCSSWTLPPLRVYYDRLHGEPVELEAVAGPLATAYLDNRELLGLKNTIWNYWMARRSPLGPNLVFMATAMESLMKGWFKSSKSRSKGVNMPKKDFDALFEEELAAVERKLDGHPRESNILNRFRGCFWMGIGEQFAEFFKELDLEVSDRERKAIRGRNSFAHGGSIANERWPELHANYQAYQTLFHRVLLRVLGYSGSYVDYTTLGHPARPVLEPAGGSPQP